MAEARSAPNTAGPGPLTPPSPAGALSKIAGPGHIGTMKSMSLLHELQEYMLSTEGAKQELENLRKEKQRLEKELRKSVDPPLPPRTARANVGNSVADFSTVDDLPPRLRAIIEDNRMLKEQGRRQKQQLKEYEGTISSQNEQILKLQDELKKLRVLTQGRQADEKTMQELQQLRSELSLRDSKLREVQSRLDVSEKARHTDQKKAQGLVQNALRDREAAITDMKMTQLALEDKDKECRKHVLRIRELQRQLDPLKNLEALQRQQAADEKRLTALRADVEEKVKHLEEPRVFVMLCLIDDESGARRRQKSIAAAALVGDGGAGARKEMSEEEAAVRIQAVFRGHQVRNQMALEKELVKGGPAAIKLEAGDEVLEAGPEGGAEPEDEGTEDAEPVLPAVAVTAAAGDEAAASQAMESPATPAALMAPASPTPPAGSKTGPPVAKTAAGGTTTRPIASQATSGRKPAAKKGMDEEGEYETVARKVTSKPPGPR